MKKAFVYSCFMIIVISSFGQHKSDNYCWKKTNGGGLTQFQRSIDVLAGLVPNKDYNAIKIDVIASNIFLKVIGLYTSIEKGVDSKYFSNTWGVNVSVFRFLYLFAGVDIFTSYGLISNVQENTTNGIRKEIGLGLYPVKNLTLRLGYSLEVGATVTVGYRFHINKTPNKLKSGRNNHRLPAYFKNFN